MQVMVPAFIAVTLGMIVFFLGAFLTRGVRVLRDYNIPEPVSGGIAVALATWGWFQLTGQQIVFDLAVRDYLLVLFFSTIGLNARIAELFRGGRLLTVLLVLTLGYMVLQNLVGVFGAALFGLPTPVAVLRSTTGSSSSKSTATASAACLAVARLSATTMAKGSPT